MKLGRCGLCTCGARRAAGASSGFGAVPSEPPLPHHPQQQDNTRRDGITVIDTTSRAAADTDGWLPE
ncbi:hypothetical protein E2C01_090469 [Portunus trituberculatus]|uniref:Uncharacterized protein n=1 Tax=Portunus trituberculatus TaxID=210409 RepID=A0A5B7JQ70_PORTR|nr:hypothetical protein [Portunus trituberculatus]